jgi:hypothetical protein
MRIFRKNDVSNAQERYRLFFPRATGGVQSMDDSITGQSVLYGTRNKMQTENACLT